MAAPTFAIFTGAGGKRFVGSTDFGPIVEHLSLASGSVINSHARDRAAAPLLHKIGLHTQAEVIRLHARGDPGFGPANPENRTSHCCFNDGVVRSDLPAGARIPEWERGIDCGDPQAFMAAARHRGLIAVWTYHGKQGEAQHVNLHTQAHSGVAGLAELRPGHVLGHPRTMFRLSQCLMVISPPGHSRKVRYLHHHHVRYTRDVVDVVRRFQRDHHQTADGDVGVHTWMQLVALEAHFKRVDRQAR